MRPHEFLALALLCAAAVAQADPSDYGKADTFQPGKKYNCVPSADRKGWDCKVTGNADIPPVPRPAQIPAAPAPAHEASPAAPAAPPAPRASALPGYLAAPDPGQTMQPMPATPAPKPAPKPRIKGPMLPARAPGPKQSVPEPVPPAPAAAPTPVQTQSVPTLPSAEPAPASVKSVPTPHAHDFLALSAASYVIELAHADSKAGLDAARAAAHPAHGKIYELHLLQNGIDAWLLLRGPFDDLESARTARAELAAQGANPGWPRRIGPLQAELRRTEH
ncbi:MAG: hypothetical protein ACYC9P_11535 [Rudaea sp.]